MAHPRSRLIEQNDGGAAGNSDADFERPLLSMGQESGHDIVAPKLVAQVAILLDEIARRGVASCS